MLKKQRLIIIAVVAVSLVLPVANTAAHAAIIDPSTNQVTTFSAANHKGPSTIGVIIDWFKHL